MEEDIESSDISAAELAAISNKGQYARSISLALSANVDEFAPVTTSSEDDDWRQSSGGPRASGCTCATFGRKTGAMVRSPHDSTTEESSISSDDETVEDTPLPDSAASHRRRRTRLQRQRLRQVQREFMASLMIYSDIDEDMQVQGADRPRQVPSLMELCMQTGISRSGPVAPGLRPVLAHHRAKARLAAQQLRWLGRNLGLLESQLKWNIVEVLEPHGVKRTHLKRDARSLWRVDWWSKNKWHPREAQWILPVCGQTYTAVDWKIAALAHYIDLMLPHQYADSHGLAQSPEKRQQHIEKVKRYLRKRYPKLVQHCFDHALAYVWWARGQCTWAQETFMKVAQTYPADQHTETGKPSTLWARHRAMVLAEIGRMLTTFDQRDTAGQFYRQAVEAAAREVHQDEVLKLSLQSLVLTASAYDQGTMDQHSAIQAASLWSAAVEQARSVRDIPEYRGQSSLWTHDKNEEKGGYEAVLAAVESLIHCHAGYPTQASANRNMPNSSQRSWAWLTEVRAYLEKLLTNPQCAFVRMHLSFVLAMLGEGDLAEDVYRGHTFSRNGFPTIDGLALLLRDDDIGPHPWWLFLDWIEARASALGRDVMEPLRVLPLVWRRGLGHPSYCHNRNARFSSEQVADVQGVTLDLHVTPQGHLCGTMLQNLPPLRKVYIDACNGALHFDNSGCEELHHWDNYYKSYPKIFVDWTLAPEHFRFNCDSMVPCPNVIYNDPETCVRVSLMMAGVSTYYRSLASEKSCQPWGDDDDRDWDETYDPHDDFKLIGKEMRPAMTAIFQSSGNSVKIDIIELVLQDHKKHILSELTKLNEHDAASIKLAEELIDYSIKQRYFVENVQTLKDFLCQRKETQKRNAQRCQQKRLPTNKTDFEKFFSHRGQSLSYILEIHLENVLYVGKTTVVLLLHTYSFDTFVFLDCSSPSNFSRPVVRNTTELMRWALPKGAHCWSTPNPTTNFLFAIMEPSLSRVEPGHDQMHLFDEKGNILCFQKPADEEEQGSKISRWYTTCYGHRLFGIRAVYRENVYRSKGQLGHRVIEHLCLANRTKAHDLPAVSLAVYNVQTGTERLSAEFPVIRDELVVVQDTLYALTQEGLYALDPITLEPLMIHQLKPSPSGLAPSDPGRLLHLEENRCLKVLGQCEVMVADDKAVTYNRTFLGLENHVLLLQRRRIGEGQLREGDKVANVLEVLDIRLPGRPTELCYIGEKAGFVVSATVFGSDFEAYFRESLYWFDTSGNIIAIHPFIGKGPHGFLPVYLKDEAAKDDGKAENKEMDLYLYFADGLGALCCARLDKSEY